MSKNNHNRTLKSFNKDIATIKKAGFNPIAVTQMNFEETFVFNSKEEAKKAYRLFERDENEKWIGKVVGWWYGKEDFLEAVKEYETENDGYSKVLVYWL